MTRKQALNLIRYEVATHGEVTREALRHKLENRVGHEAFQKAVKLGLEYYNAQLLQDEPVSLITLAENREQPKPLNMPERGEVVSIFDL